MTGLKFVYSRAPVPKPIHSNSLLQRLAITRFSGLMHNIQDSKCKSLHKVQIRNEIFSDLNLQINGGAQNRLVGSMSQNSRFTGVKSRFQTFWIWSTAVE